MIRTNCPSCATPIKVDVKFAGRKAKCGKCAALITIPQPEEVQADEEPEEYAIPEPPSPPPLTVPAGVFDEDDEPDDMDDDPAELPAVKSSPFGMLRRPTRPVATGVRYRWLKAVLGCGRVMVAIEIITALVGWTWQYLTADDDSQMFVVLSAPAVLIVTAGTCVLMLAAIDFVRVLIDTEQSCRTLAERS